MGIGGRVRCAQRLSELQVPRGGEQVRRRRRADGAAHNLLRTNVGLEGLTLRNKIPPRVASPSSGTLCARTNSRCNVWSCPTPRSTSSSSSTASSRAMPECVGTGFGSKRPGTPYASAQGATGGDLTDRPAPHADFPVPAGAGQRRHPVGPGGAGAVRSRTTTTTTTTTGKAEPVSAGAARALLTGVGHRVANSSGPSLLAASRFRRRVETRRSTEIVSTTTTGSF
jgi:hypothetical protein